ncbi:arrestin-like protein [Diplodia corticola]|uniref:Arrestin-like protein n=1 Tax=Diplodia corticola TaxID=236234 RepID=A0A1J9S8U2_9PEZI|nr:arrestin-like protein [Diplodia corticola]OJD36332.1 arrestin-like protein [Diplodia corticola]
MLRPSESAHPPPEKGPPPALIRPQRSLSAIPKSTLHARTRSVQKQLVPGPRKPAPQMSQAPAWSTSGAPPWSTLTRPLSDIRELTEPSLLELTNRKALQSESTECRVARKCSLTRKGSLLSRKGSHSRRPSLKRATSPAESQHSNHRRGRPSPFQTPGSDRSSVYSIPIANIPPRSSSRTRKNRANTMACGPSLPPPAPRGLGFTIPNRGLSRSPVREVAARLDPVSSDVVQRIPSRTFTRDPSDEVVEFPTHRHPRISVDIQLAAPLFVGGGSLEGNVRIIVEDAERQRHKRALAIARISVDLLGVEEMWNGKRDIFMDLATELVDSDNPPPENMVDSVKQVSPLDPFWLLHPSTTTMPFSISLPLDVGPPPFQSKLARIRYVLSCTLLVRDKGVQYLVRNSQGVSLLSVYDPEKALMSLPSPLTASDEYTRPREGAVEVIRVTAGLHRQVWTAASTLEKSAGQARIFDNNERTVFAKTSIKQGMHGWSGVAPHTTVTRTCDLELPRGHATVKCGRFFEVRYFLNIIVSSTHSKLVTVQLPIVLIHMNSLDVVPNSVAQVAAAIEEKRGNSTGRRARALSRRPSRSVQGCAFAAPRIQSLERMRAEAEDLREIGNILERSPRKYKPATKLTTTVHADGSTSVKKEHVIRRIQSATPKLTNRRIGHKLSTDTIGLNSAVGLGYGYHSSNNLAGACSSTSDYDSDDQLASAPIRHRRVASSPGLETPSNGNRLGRFMEIGSVESLKDRLRHMRTRSNETTHSQRSSTATHGLVTHHHHHPLGPKQSVSLHAHPGSARSHSRTGSNTNSSAGPPLPPHYPPPLAPPLPSRSSSQHARQPLGFREAEVSMPKEDIVDLGTGGSGGGYPGAPGGGAGASTSSTAFFGGVGSSGAASFKARLDAARDRQWRFQGTGGGGGHGGHHNSHHHAGARTQQGGVTGHHGRKWRDLPERGLEWIMGDREEREKEKEKERRRAMDNWI